MFFSNPHPPTTHPPTHTHHHMYTLSSGCMLLARYPLPPLSVHLMDPPPPL